RVRLPRRFFGLFRPRCRCCVRRRLIRIYNAKIALSAGLACREFHRRKPGGEFFSDVLNINLFRMKNVCEKEHDKQKQDRLGERNGGEKPELAQYVRSEERRVGKECR